MKKVTSLLIVGLMFVLVGCQDSSQSESSIILLPDDNTQTVATNEPESDADQDITEVLDTAELLVNGSEKTIVTLPESLNSTNSVFLIELEPAEVSNIHGGLRRGITYMREPIIIDGVTYEHGLATHTPTSGVGKVIYTLNKEYTMFHTKVGVTSHGNVVFGIYGDDTQLFLSPPVTQTNGVTEVTVDVSDVDILTLTVDKVNRNFGDHAVWCDPVLIK